MAPALGYPSNIRSNETSPIQDGNPTSGTSAVGFMIPLIILVSMLLILFAGCSYQALVICRRQLSQTSAATTARQINTATLRLARKERIGREVESETFAKWRTKQLEQMKNQAAISTQVVCMVCLNEFTEVDLVRDLNCTHVFHVDCLDEWYSRGHNQCPLCKSELCHLNAAEADSGCQNRS